LWCQVIEKVPPDSVPVAAFTVPELVVMLMLVGLTEASEDPSTVELLNVTVPKFASGSTPPL
jgi:hypothetical protein